MQTEVPEVLAVADDSIIQEAIVQAKSSLEEPQMQQQSSCKCTQVLTGNFAVCDKPEVMLNAENIAMQGTRIRKLQLLAKLVWASLLLIRQLRCPGL